MAQKAVAKIGDAMFVSLQKAVDAAQAGETVELLADVTENVIVPVGKDITLDLGGKTLTWPSLACKGGTVQSGTLKVSGVIDLIVGDHITNTGTIDLSGATINLVDPENLTGAGFTFISGSGAVTGKPAATNLPKGWGVSISGSKARISKGGMTIILR